MLNRFLLFCSVLFMGVGLYAQSDPVTDSLLGVVAKAPHDTGTVSAFVMLSNNSSGIDFDQSMSYARRGMDVALELEDSIWRGRCYYQLGLASFYFSHSKEAIDFFDSAIVFLGVHPESQYWVAKSLNGMGNSQRRVGLVKEATDSYLAAKEIFETIGDKKGIAGAYNNLGIIFMYENQQEKALEYYRIARIMNIQINNIPWLAKNYSNMGSAFYNLNMYDSAEVYFRQGIDLSLEVGDTAGWALDHMNLGNVLTSKKDYEGALEQYDRALSFYTSHNFEVDVSLVLLNLGGLYTSLHEYDKAKYYLDSSAAISRRYGDLANLIEVYKGYAFMYEGSENYKNAYYYYTRFATMRDSVMSGDMKNQMDQMEESLREEKLKEKNASLEQSKKLQDVQINRSNIIIASAVGGILLVLLLAFVIYKRYQLKTRANDLLRERNAEIELQKGLIEQKSKDISDSINYAKRIQDTVIPDPLAFYKAYDDSFVLYRPRNVVSGDFYWYSLSENRDHIAVADCTGHGVPGAFMSMLSIDKLHHNIVESKIIQPAQALGAVNRSLRLALRQQDDEDGMRDGMDIALIAIDRKVMKLEYAGANRPLWIIRNNEIVELAPSKASIGGHTTGSYEFSSQEFELKKNDCIYLFTDGYADQFGGPDGRKMMTKRLREIVLSVAHLPMNEQKELISQRFDQWKGALEQVDDVCVLGIRI